MLSEGYLQGAFYPALLDSVKKGEGCERIFENPFQEEKDYYRKTGIFPLMHTVVIRDKILEKAPWAAESIYEAFKKSRDIGLKKLEDPRTSALAWARKYLEEEKSLFGGSHWSYGLTGENLRALDKLQEYSLQQEIIPSIYDLEDLFVISTREETNRV
ncbi:MAG: hypothetical protein ABEI54_03615 [Candidatus Bipolaricaulia bacterium]